MNLIRRIPANVVNGIVVAAGIASIQIAFGALGGAHAAQLAVSGAVCTSLADVPSTVSRTRHRVPAAAVLSLLAALTVDVLRTHPALLGSAIALIGFIAMMTMAWGLRAGAVSFAPILSLVFAMAMPPSAEPLVVRAGWNAAGAAAYLLWALAAGWWLQRRYRALALSAAIGSAAALLRARADLLLQDCGKTTGAADAAETSATALQAWVRREAELADRLQTARDFIFAQNDSDTARRDTAILLRLIDLRDVLLASQLDLEVLVTDAPGRAVLRQLGNGLRTVASALDIAVVARRDGVAPVAWQWLAPDGTDGLVLLPADDARASLLPALALRLRSLGDDAAAIHSLLCGGHEAAPLTRAELRRFVAPEGWPWQALRAQWNWQSPVLRHALRASLALSSAYFIALALPWASHPHWLVLSVAVVLRGSLAQTLSRRNARVLGTLLGCAVVVALSGARSAPALGIVFLVAVGVAHAYVTQRYWLTALAATVMALLQSHLVNPGAGFAVGERVADTLFGALLAWGFSYVLPSWERRSLPAAIARVMKDVGAYAALVLQVQTRDAVEQRLARRRAYDALAALTAVLQRSGAEPASVRPPVAALAALLDHGQRLMAHLSVVRLALSEGGAELDAVPAAQALEQARAALAIALAAPATSPSPAPPAHPDDPARWPQHAPDRDRLPWLQRRLRLVVHGARQLRNAASDALAPSGPSAPSG
jgi:uncharacterized membrane protein YccC